MKGRIHLTAGQHLLIGVFLCALIMRTCEMFNFSHSDLFSLIRSVLFVTVCAAWGISIRQRVISVPIRRYLTAMAALMVFWMLIRACKFQYTDATSAFNRYLWYLYYLPMLFLPLLTLLTAVCIWQPDSYQLPAGYRWLAAVPTGLLLAVLSNDLHQLAFSFPLGIAQGTMVYHHQIIYWLCAVWMIAAELSGLAMLLHQSRIPGGRMIWLPFAMLGAVVLYSILSLLPHSGYEIFFVPLPEYMCFFTLAIVESCLICHLIPANSQYGSLFQISTVAAQIMDRRYAVCVASETAPLINADEARKAEQGPVRLDAGHLLKSSAISGGHVLYVEDVSEINARLQQLREVGEELAGRNDLLQAEIRLKQKLVQVSEQNRLYDKISETVAAQMDEIIQLLSADQSSDQAAENLVRICIIGSYVKRRSNLILIGEKEKRIPAEELERCLRESMDYIRLAGIHCSFERTVTGSLDVYDIELIYDLFEAVAETALQSAHALLVNLQTKENLVDLKMQYEADDEPELTALQQRLSKRGCMVQTSQEDGIEYLSLRLSQEDRNNAATV